MNSSERRGPHRFEEEEEEDMVEESREPVSGASAKQAVSKGF